MKKKNTPWAFKIFKGALISSPFFLLMTAIVFQSIDYHPIYLHKIAQEKKAIEERLKEKSKGKISHKKEPNKDLKEAQP